MADINQLILQRIKKLGNAEAAKFFGIKVKNIITVKRTKKASADMMAQMFQEFEVEQEEEQQEPPTGPNGEELTGDMSEFEVAEEAAPVPAGRKGKGIQPAQHKARHGEAQMFTTPEGADLPRSLTRPAGSPTVVSPRDSGRRFSGVGRHGEDNVVTGRIAPRPGGHKSSMPCPAGVAPAVWQMVLAVMAAGGVQNTDITGSVESDAPMQGNVMDNFPDSERFQQGWNTPRNHQGPDQSQDNRGPQPRRVIRRRQ